MGRIPTYTIWPLPLWDYERMNEWMNLLKVEFELAQHTTKQLELSENLREDWLSQWKILRLLKLVYASNLDQLMNCFTKDIVLG